MLRLSKTDSVLLPVTLRIPTDKPGAFNEGSIDVLVKVLSKERLKEMSEQEVSDADHIKEFVKSVTGLGDADGNPITGEEALNEVLNGTWSNFLQTAILQAYFGQFGEARVKNSKTSRGR
ncbi:MAG: hypothetical protein ACREPD_16230 [Stenotrophomonas sp.]|uniref:hypothetical protein n=1 Tax=Stenotrophomonas sp. TaxID=69392 RepID=UPI003D6CC114